MTDTASAAGAEQTACLHRRAILEQFSRPGRCRRDILCATLAATTLAGLVLFAGFGWWSADPAAALAIAWFAVREGRETWHGELACDD